MISRSAPKQDHKKIVSKIPDPSSVSWLTKLICLLSGHDYHGYACARCGKPYKSIKK